MKTTWQITIPLGLILWIVGSYYNGKYSSPDGTIGPISSAGEAVVVGISLGGFVVLVVGIVDLVKYIKTRKANK